MEVDVIVTSNNSKDFRVEYLNENSIHTYKPSSYCFEQKTTDSNKLKNIADSFKSNSDIILAMRGGAGATRLMHDVINLEAPITPKKFIGYSDLTVFLNYFNKFDNIELIHGPMAFELTTKKRISKLEAAIDKQDVVFDKPAKWLVEGMLEGNVIGGNLMLVTDMLGTSYEPDFDNKILLLEEIDEPIDKLDRMFAQLRDNGALDKISGIILGNFKNCASEEELLALFNYYLSGLNIPVLYNLNLGHIDDSDYIYLHTNLKIDESGIYYKKTSN